MQLLAQWSRGCDGGLPWWESNGPGGKDQLAPLAIVCASNPFSAGVFLDNNDVRCPVCRVRGTQWAGYSGPPLPSPRLKIALSGQQLVELLNVLSSQPGWDRHAVARAVCAYATDVLPPSQKPCAMPVGGFEGALVLSHCMIAQAVWDAQI